MQNKIGQLILISFLYNFFSINCYSTNYIKTNNNENIIGSLQYATVVANDTVTKIITHYDVGYDALVNANKLDFTKPLIIGSSLLIPTQHLLPMANQKGIIVNLPEMRMYFFMPNTHSVITYPLGIGKVGDTIPIQNAVITQKAENPNWKPTPHIREFNLAQGVILPQVMPSGPDNPLGSYAIYMSIPTYLMHSTIFPESIGRRASFGCFRMHSSDIKKLFPLVTIGLPITILNMPIKINWQADHLFMEAHPSLSEHKNAENASLSGTVKLIDRLVNHGSQRNHVLVDWQAVYFIEQERDGIPHEIGIRV